MMMARNGEAVAATVIGGDSPIQKSTETFLPIGNIQINQTTLFIGGALIGLLVVSLVGIYLSKKKKRTAQATTDTENIEK
jgi:LPXTG-motif cell wall-anchored protein